MEPSYCHVFQLFQAARRDLLLMLEGEKDQPQQGEDSVRASLLEFLACQRMSSEQHLSEPKVYYIELFPSQADLISVEDKFRRKNHIQNDRDESI